MGGFGRGGAETRGGGMTSSDEWLTTGNYPDEPAAVAALLAALGDRWFKPYREVVGSYLYTRPLTEECQPRADLLLRPLAAAVDAGWSHGVIGVECKRSGVKLGPLVAQVLDYQGAVFYPDGGTGVVPTYWALWPAGRITGPMDSILVQRRILTADVASARGGVWVLFRNSGCVPLRVSTDTLRVGSLANGGKRGSR